MSKVVLKVGGKLFSGWKTVKLWRAMDALAGSFSVSVSPEAPRAKIGKLAPGQACEIYVEDDVVLTGFIDGVSVQYDAAQHSITVTGRSKTADLIDCSATHKPGQWQNVDLDVILRDLISEFGLELDMQADGGAPFSNFAIEDGESAFEAIERLCRMRSVLPTTNSLGNLVIMRANTPSQRYEIELVQGQNILSATGTFTNVERYRTYHVWGQHPATPYLPDGVLQSVQSTASDAGIVRHRPLVVLAEQALSKDETQARATWESNVRSARSRQIKLIIAGSGVDEVGELWQPSRIVRCRDSWLGIDSDLLITRTMFVLDDQGTRSEIECVLPGAFTPEPQIEDMKFEGWV